MAGVLTDTGGRSKPIAPARTQELALAPYLATRTLQQQIFKVAEVMTRRYIEEWQSSVPAHVLFPQLARIVQRYLIEKVRIIGEPKDVRVVFVDPYYATLLERLLQNLKPDVSSGSCRKSRVSSHVVSPAAPGMCPSGPGARCGIRSRAM
jgi:type III restriction enzyme